MEALVGLSATEALMIIARAGLYLAALVTAGSLLVAWLLPRLPGSESRLLKVLVPSAAAVTLFFALAGVALRAVFLGGDDWGSALDPSLLTLALSGTTGDSMLVLVIGLVLALGVGFSGAIGAILAALSAVAIAASFALTGHPRGADGWLLVGLVSLHWLLLAFWVGIFIPLYRASGYDTGHAARLARDFGRRALVAVPVLAVAGAITLHHLTGGLPAVMDIAYGQLFAVKLALFAGALLLAARNRLSLTPALERGDAMAGERMRRSLGWEGLLIIGVLLVTATVTTLTTPPM